MDPETKSQLGFARKVLAAIRNGATIILVVLADLFLAYVTYKLLRFGYIPLAICFIIIIATITVAFLVPKAHHFRWMAVGLSAWLLFSIFPILYTAYNAFTNYGDGHLITKEIAISQIQAEGYLPENAKPYSWTAFRSNDQSEYILFLKSADGETMLVRQSDSAKDDKVMDLTPGANGIGELDASGIPISIEGYARLSRIAASTDQKITGLRFGEPERAVQIKSPSEAAQSLPLYNYDEATGNFVNALDGTVYTDIKGTWTSSAGKKLIPGYTAIVKADNFVQFVTSPGLRGPLATIVVWNFLFAAFSLLLTFSVGLGIAIIFGEPKYKGKKLLRSLLLIPYTIPSLITILIWRGMFNPELGIINKLLSQVLHIAPKWFTNPYLARTALLIVNTWLGYPYWMLVTSGALQSIPGDVYEAAQIDGASAWQRFWNITLPLLLVSVGPLMISSFIFNFNNFNLIYAFINGGPPIPTATTQAGYTDIIISYVYNLAFASGRGAQYGYASAISLVLFMLIAVMSLLQFRFTNMWEEVGENA